MRQDLVSCRIFFVIGVVIRCDVVNMIQKLKQHYEKVICACCFLLLFTNVGLASTSFSVYQPYLVELPGVGHSGGSIVISIRTFISVVAMFFVARYYEKLDCRKGVALASFCIGTGFVIYALSTSNFIGLCVGSIFTGLGYGLGGMVASTMLIGRWFKDHVATAAGIAAVGSGVAAVVVPPVVVALESAFSLSSAFVAEGALALFDAVALYLLLRNRPEDMGLTPYVDPKLSSEVADGSCNDETKAENEAKQTRHASKKSSRKMQQGTRINRNLPPRMVPVVLVAMVIVGCVSVGGSNYLAVLFTSEGFTTEYAALLVSISGACLMLSKLFTGVVFDKIGTAKGSFVFFAIFIIGIMLLCLSDMGNHNLALVGVLFYGTGLALGTVGISIWSIELAPRGQQVKTIKNFQIAYALGGFIFTFLPGFLMEATGTYLVSYAALLVMVTLAATIIVGLYVVLDRRAMRAFNKQSGHKVK